MVFLEPVQDLDQWMQRKATVDETAQHTGVCEHLESTFNTASPQSAIQRDLEQVLRHKANIAYSTGQKPLITFDSNKERA